MAGYIGTKAVLLSTTTASVGGDSTVGGDLTVDTNTLYVDSANNRVGIGTSSPSSANALNKVLNIDVSSSEKAGISLSENETNRFDVFFDGSDNSAHLYNSASGGMRFYGTGTERMRIDASGNLLVGTTNSNPQLQNSDYGAVISSSGRIYALGDGHHDFNRNSNGEIIRFRRSATQVGSISVTSSSTAYNTSSDYRLKTDAQPMTGASARVQSLNPVNFEWISSGERVDGFLAHEAQAVVPEAVTGTKDAVDADGNPVYQGIDQSKLVPLLTAALQEALTKIDALETRITALEAV